MRRCFATIKRVNAGGGRVYRVENAQGQTTLPSVTGVLNIIEKAALLPWALRICTDVVRKGYLAHRKSAASDPDAWLEPVLAKAIAQPDVIKTQSAIFGTRVHAAIDAIIRGDQPRPPVARDIAHVVTGFETWYAGAGIRFAPAGDTVVYSLRHGYAGAMDAMGYRTDGSAIVVCDFKTSNSTQPTHALQLAAYAAAVREMWIDGTLDVPALLAAKSPPPQPALASAPAVTGGTDGASTGGSASSRSASAVSYAALAQGPLAEESTLGVGPAITSGPAGDAAIQIAGAAGGLSFSAADGDLSSFILGGGFGGAYCNGGADPAGTLSTAGPLPPTSAASTSVGGCGVMSLPPAGLSARAAAQTPPTGQTTPPSPEPAAAPKPRRSSAAARAAAAAAAEDDLLRAHPIVDSAFLMAAAAAAASQVVASSPLLPGQHALSSSAAASGSSVTTVSLSEGRTSLAAAPTAHASAPVAASLPAGAARVLKRAFSSAPPGQSPELWTTHLGFDGVSGVHGLNVALSQQSADVASHPNTLQAASAPAQLHQSDRATMPFMDPYTTPIEALVIRLDKATGEIDVQRVVSLPTAFSAFLAALRLHEILKLFPGGRNSGAASPQVGDVTGPLLEKVTAQASASPGPGGKRN